MPKRNERKKNLVLFWPSKFLAVIEPTTTYPKIYNIYYFYTSNYNNNYTHIHTLILTYIQIYQKEWTLHGLVNNNNNKPDNNKKTYQQTHILIHYAASLSQKQNIYTYQHTLFSYIKTRTLSKKKAKKVCKKSLI